MKQMVQIYTQYACTLYAYTQYAYTQYAYTQYACCNAFGRTVNLSIQSVSIKQCSLWFWWLHCNALFCGNGLGDRDVRSSCRQMASSHNCSIQGLHNQIQCTVFFQCIPLYLNSVFPSGFHSQMVLHTWLFNSRPDRKTQCSRFFPV